METNLSLPHKKSGNGLINCLTSKNTITDLNFAQDGDSIHPPGRRIHLRHRTGNKAATGSQIEAGIRGKHHPGLNSNFASLFRDVISFSGDLISWQPTGCVDRHTYRALHILMHSSCTVSMQSCCQSVQSHIDPKHLHGSSHEAQSAFHPKTFTPHTRRAMSYTLQNVTPRTGTPSSPFPESVFHQSAQPCENQRHEQSGALTELPTLTS